MTNHDLSGVLLILGFFCLIPISFFASLAEDRRREREDKVKNDEFLAAERAKPRCAIKFTSVGQNNAMVIGGFEPYVEYYYPRYWHHTSRDVAESHLEACYKRGYFRAANGSTVPSCNITEAFVTEETREA